MAVSEIDASCGQHAERQQDPLRQRDDELTSGLLVGVSGRGVFSKHMVEKINQAYVDQTVGVIQVIDPFVRMLQVVTLATPEQRDGCHLEMTGGRYSKADPLDFAGKNVRICEVATFPDQHSRICRQNPTRAHQSDARRNRRTSEL